MIAKSVDELIGDLGADLVPVKRLRSPWLRALGWLGIVAATAMALATVADLPALALRLGAATDMWMAVVGSVLTTALAAVAAFELSYPDRHPSWALLPLPGLALWLGESGLGCLRSFPIEGLHPADMHDMRGCFVFIVGLSVPLSLLMMAMIRRACPLRPNLTAAVAGLAVAAASATLLTFIHPHEAGAADLAVHVIAIALVIAANQLAGGRLLTRSGSR